MKILNKEDIEEKIKLQKLKISFLDANDKKHTNSSMDKESKKYFKNFNESFRKLFRENIKKLKSQLPL